MEICCLRVSLKSKQAEGMHTVSFMLSHGVRPRYVACLECCSPFTGVSLRPLFYVCTDPPRALSLVPRMVCAQALSDSPCPWTEETLEVPEPLLHHAWGLGQIWVLKRHFMDVGVETCDP